MILKKEERGNYRKENTQFCIACALLAVILITAGLITPVSGADETETTQSRRFLPDDNGGIP